MYGSVDSWQYEHEKYTEKDPFNAVVDFLLVSAL